MWQWVVQRWSDIVIAAVLALFFAVIFAVIADAISVGSRVREALRHVANKISERSVGRLAKRITILKNKRTQLSSARAMILLAMMSSLQCLYMLALGCFSFGVVLLSRTSSLAYRLALDGLPGGVAPSTIFNAYAIVGLFAFAVAIASAMSGMRVARVHSAARIKLAIQQLDNEIASLEQKLQTRRSRAA